jgi:hypothetical protein
VASVVRALPLDAADGLRRVHFRSPMTMASASFASITYPFSSRVPSAPYLDSYVDP